MRIDKPHRFVFPAGKRLQGEKKAAVQSRHSVKLESECALRLAQGGIGSAFACMAGGRNLAEVIIARLLRKQQLAVEGDREKKAARAVAEGND